MLSGSEGFNFNRESSMWSSGRLRLRKRQFYIKESIRLPETTFDFGQCVIIINDATASQQLHHILSKLQGNNVYEHPKQFMSSLKQQAVFLTLA